MESIEVEVFPIEPDRWISVINAPRGAFSTEVRRPRDVMPDVEASATAVLGRADFVFRFVDDEGKPWAPAVANEQLQRLGVQYRPERRGWAGRLFHRATAFRGDCPACGHDWREHIPTDGRCSECVYEIEHDEPNAPTRACRIMPPPVDSRRT